MKVGNYVRTLDGIMKVVECRDNRFVNEDGNVYFYSDMMCNPSSNIIDLIRKGDYVNGHKVFDTMRIDTDDYGNDFKEIGIEIDNMLNHYIREEDIKSIVTCEQFEAMKYKVESKVN